MPLDQIKYVHDRPYLSQWNEGGVCATLEEWGLVEWLNVSDWSVPVHYEYTIDPRTEQEFERLVREWKDETWFISSIKKRILHPAYLKIIALGKAVVPLIIAELRREPDYWHYALEALTGEDPAENASTVREIGDAWLLWGTERGY